jgi:hypothetical protein
MAQLAEKSNPGSKKPSESAVNCLADATAAARRMPLPEN